jgi:DNA topoisomerase I
MVNNAILHYNSIQAKSRVLNSIVIVNTVFSIILVGFTIFKEFYMSKKLVIVESPAKARTIAGILGDEYTIMASMGHVRDLPKNSIGVDVNNNFNPKYVATKSKTITELKKVAKGADEIYLATDPDREGEAIAWHLQEVLSQKSKAKFSRIEFHEITKTAILKAFEKPKDVDLDLVDSQQARRILDRLVGYQVSPLLWSRIQRNISAGRVQSVALRVVCERERDILSFEPKEYWNFAADFLWKNVAGKKYSAKLLKVNGKKVEIGNQEEVEAVFSEIDNSQICEIGEAKQEVVQKRASAPFITSTLQQSAGTNLRFTANRTMQIAQQLYEGVAIENDQTVGLITYMRTDSFTLSQEAINKCRGFIVESFGEKFQPSKPNYYKNKSNAQEAHEAIRPTNVFRTPESVKDYLTTEQYNLYRLIWNRFVACQMSPAQVSKTTIDTKIEGEKNNTYIFRTISNVTLFSGFEKVLRANKEEISGPVFLTEIKKNDSSTLLELNNEQKFTDPPSRFSEPSLIRELESNGIGRPSTYASIINTIQKRQYAEKEKGKLKPTDLGFNVNDYLVEFLEALFNVGFTAEMENKLDAVEAGKESWTSMLDEFYQQFQEWLDAAKYKEAPDVDKVAAVFKCIDSIDNWEVQEAKTPRAKNDKTFVASIKKQFEKNNKLSKKQWDSLLKVAIKYSDQISDFVEVAAKFNFAEDVSEIKEVMIQEEKAKIEKQKEYGAVTEKMINAINLLSEESINEFTFNNSFRFSEETFFNSLIKRAKQKQTFTDKQQNVFCRIIMGNKDKISNFDDLKEALGFSEEDFQNNAGGKPIDESKVKEITDLLMKFDDFAGWAEPQKKGRRTFNDKDFFSSLKKQFAIKKQLSVKQVFALKKLVTKYFEKSS